MLERDEDHVVTLDAAARKELRRLARRLELAPHDLLLVGDGSGQTCEKPAGWACVAYDRLLKRAVVHAGALTSGTTGFAELIPFWHALWHFGQEHRDDRVRGYQVAIISDSEVTVRCGNRVYQRQANGCLWAGIEWFEQCGYVLNWHHVRRLSNHWNALADSLAGEARRLAQDLKESMQDQVGSPTVEEEAEWQ